jgi:hypothetical protein
VAKAGLSRESSATDTKFARTAWHLSVIVTPLVYNFTIIAKKPFEIGKIIGLIK